MARYAAGFEALRNRSDAFLAARAPDRRVLLLPLGPLAEHNIRTTFAANLLASGGIEAVNPGPLDAAGRRGGGRRCRGPDASPCSAVPTPVTAPRPPTWWPPRTTRGVEQVYLAGPEKAVAERPPPDRTAT